MQGRFASVEEFSQAISQGGWLTNFQQLDCGRGGAEFTIVKSDAVMLQQVAFERSVRQVVRPLEGHHNFGILSGPSSVAQIGNRQLNSEAINCFHEVDGFEAAAKPGFTAYTLSVKKCRVAELAHNLGYANPGDDKDIWGAGMVPVPERFAAVRAKIRQISDFSNSVGLPPQRLSELQELLELELPALVLHSFKHAEVIKRIPMRNRARALKRALDYIDAHPREALTVEKLCIESASSLSTLERAFRERYGVSPKRYMLLQRLHHVRRALLHQAESRKIFEIANEYGFWHMSKFAMDYKKVFGHLPSQTLKGPRLLSSHAYIT
jgi:AraC-like DNA-binding protein